MAQLSTDEAVLAVLNLLSELEQELVQPDPPLERLRDLAVDLMQALVTTPPPLDRYMNMPMFSLRGEVEDGTVLRAVELMMDASKRLEASPPDPYPGIVRHVLRKKFKRWQIAVMRQQTFDLCWAIYMKSVAAGDVESVLSMLESMSKDVTDPTTPAGFKKLFQAKFNETREAVAALGVPVSGLDSEGKRTNFELLYNHGEEQGYLEGFPED